MSSASRVEGKKKCIGVLMALSVLMGLMVPIEGRAEGSQLPPSYSMPNCFVEGVNLLTGTYNSNVVDLATEGVDPIVLSRYYSSESAESGWNYALSKTLLMTLDKDQKWVIQYPDGQGGAFSFIDEYAQYRIALGPNDSIYRLRPLNGKFRYDPHSDKKDASFTGQFSAHNHPDNIRLEANDWHVTAYHGDGTTRRFVRVESQGLPFIYELDKETLPSGNERIHRSVRHNDSKKGCVKIETRSVTGKVLNNLTVDNLYSKENTATTTPYDQGVVKYKRYISASKKLNNLIGNHFFKEVVGPDKILQTYKYTGGLLTEKALPNDRRLTIHYKRDRVKKIEQPTPNDLTHGQYAISHTFSYPKRDDKTHATQVTLANDGMISVLSHQGRLREYARHVRVNSPDDKKPVYNTASMQKFIWGNKEKCEDLLAIVLFPYGGSQAEGCRTFSYDNRHNMIEERFFGNLSGTCPHRPRIEFRWTISSWGVESFGISYRYSDDGRNLLLETKEESGKITTCFYKPGTQLLTAELVGDGTKNIQRTFHTYNDQSVCVETIIDDGVNQDVNDLTGVTTRRVIRKKIKEEGLGIGLPLSEEEFYQEEGQLKPLSTRVYTYDHQGRVIRREFFGANGERGPSLAYSYDAAGRLVAVTDSTGTVSYLYDENGNRIQEKYPSGLIHYNTYDRLNHLIERNETGPGEERIWRYKYNTLGQCIEEIDPLGQKTIHEFDGLGREIRTRRPSVLSAQATLVESVEENTYDLCDRKIETRNAAGHLEKTEYNMRGQIIKKTFADGSFEINEYTLGGGLKKTVSRLGLTSYYDTDFMGRAIVKKDYALNGKLLSTIRYVYQGLLLKSMIQEGGSAVSYRYDGAGRIIEQERNQQLDVSYTYDAFGRVHTKKEWVDRLSAKVTTYLYDNKDQVVNEKVSDLQGNLFSEQSYVYDQRGNRLEVRYTVGGQPVSTKTRYDVWNRTVETTDAEGNLTHYSYDKEENTLGQQVLKITRCDAMGRLHIALHHANGQVAEERDIDTLGVLLKSHKLFYDAMNQVVERHDTVYTNGVYTRDIVTKWSYSPMGHVATLIEAMGTPEEKQTHTLYTPDGQPKRVQMPNGDVHTFEYNVKGEKTKHEDQSGSFLFLYSYDNRGNLIEMIDQVAGNTTKRQFDLRGRMQSEELGNGMTIQYRHDLLGRVKQITLPDGSLVSYTHDPVYLRSVTRLDPSGRVRYTHAYTEIDQGGNTLKAELACDAGEIETTYTKRGMVQSIQHNMWSQQIPSDGYDPIGSLLSCTTSDPSGQETERYSYDALNQLVQEEGYIPHDYTYDSLYNRQVQDGVQGQFNSLNQLLDRGDQVYSYNKNGQTISIENAQGRTDYSYDGLGRLIALEKGNQRTTYTYDPLHRRLTKTHWTRGENQETWCEKEIQRYLYLDQNEVGHVDQEGNMLTFRTLGRSVGAEMGASVALEIGNHVYVPIHNQSGSIAALLEEGRLIEYARYSAFGESKLFNINGQVLEESALGNPWGYSSKRVDPESGWVFFGRRYYDPTEGRWMTPDPLGFAEGPNLYAYVLNNPLTHFDSYGLYGQPTNREVTREALNYLQRAAQSTYNFAVAVFRDFRPFLQIPGKAIEMIGRHLLPIPGIRDVVMGIGRLLSFRPFGGCYQCKEYDCMNIAIGDVDVPGMTKVVTNGMNCPFQDFIDQTRQTSVELGNQKIYATYNPTRGIILDLLRSLYIMVGGIAEASYKIVDNWMLARVELDSQPNGEKGVIIHECHSQGGQNTWAASQVAANKDLLKTIEVNTYGSAKLIPDDGTFKSAKNYVSKRDAVPALSCPHVWGQAQRCQTNVVFIESKGPWFVDHGLETYRDPIRKNNDRIKKRLLGE